MLNLSRPIAAAVLLLGFGPLALAATDLADTPINSTRISLAKPNIMLLMDASISMNFTHAPDQLEGTATPPPAAQPIGYRANQCNSLYYNPATVYKLPVDATGANLPTPVFSAARYNHYSSDASVRDLNSAFRAFDQNSRARNMADANDVAQRAYYYVYSGTAALSYNSAPCTDAYDPASANSAATVAALGGQWRRVLVGDPAVIGGTLDERQNFANWYAYYRSRIALVKSGVGLAFGTLSDRFRVGFITANPLQHSPGVAPVAGSSVVDSLMRF